MQNYLFLFIFISIGVSYFCHKHKNPESYQRSTRPITWLHLGVLRTKIYKLLYIKISENDFWYMKISRYRVGTYDSGDSNSRNEFHSRSILIWRMICFCQRLPSHVWIRSSYNESRNQLVDLSALWTINILGLSSQDVSISWKCILLMQLCFSFCKNFGIWQREPRNFSSMKFIRPFSSCLCRINFIYLAVREGKTTRLCLPVDTLVNDGDFPTLLP